MYLEIITPDKKVFEGDVNLVQLPGSKGSFTSLKNHAPSSSVLDKESIKFIDDLGKTHYVSCNGGVIENLANKIIVLVESA